MNLHPVIQSRKAYAVLCGTALVVAIATFAARADEWDKKTVLTVNEPIQVRDTLLQPGQYVFRLHNSSSDRHIVQIFNADQSHIINTVLAIPKERMEPTGKSEFTFWETPPGTARALRAWFYPGDTIGQEFPYPKHLTTIATATAPPPSPAPAPAVQPAEPQPQPQAAAEEPARETQPVETAQSTPPPAPVEPPPPAATESQADRQQPAELPKTASPYPLIGLSGLILLGISGLLRPRHSV